MKRKIWLGVCVMALGVVACGGGVDDASEATAADVGELMAPSFVVDPSWPIIPNDWVFGITSGLSIDADNNIWVLTRPRTVAPEDVDNAAPPVMVFDTDGNLINSWGGEGQGYEWPATEHGIYVDHDNYVWIAGSGAGDDQILKFTTDGEFVMQIGRANQSRGNTDTLFMGPSLRRAGCHTRVRERRPVPLRPRLSDGFAVSARWTQRAHSDAIIDPRRAF